MTTCRLPFCLFIALAISGCGKGDTGPKAITNEAEAVVKLLRQKLATANGMIAPRQMESFLLLWDDEEDIAIDVRESDSVVTPYTGTAEISFYEELSVSELRHSNYFKDLNLQDGKQVTLSSFVESAVRNGITDHRDGKTKLSKQDMHKNIREARDRDKGGKTLRFNYQYTDSKWKLVKCERTDRDGKIAELKLADFPQFQ